MTDKKVLNSRERAVQCAALALDKKALDVKIYEISKHSSIADYLVLANGRSDKQAQAIADSVKQGLRKYGKALDVEGMQEGRWVIIDYGDVICQTAGTDADFTIVGVKDPRAVQALVDRERDRERVRIRG